MVRRKMCPDTSCPLRSLGRADQEVVFVKSVVREAKSVGWVAGESEDLVWQYSMGTLITSPDIGTATIHSPPEATTTRSINGGPKNHPVKASQASVTTTYWSNRFRDLVLDGLVAYNNANAPEVHPHAFLMNTVLSGLDLFAK